MRRIGFPWSERMVERSRRASGGTLGACLAALEEGFAANLAGGTHHAFADRGEGYCVFNDSAIAARAVQAEGLVERVVVVDTDVHQGNGTAAILGGDPSVFTFSIHGARNFPFRKEESDLDVALPDGADDGEYLDALEGALEKALDRIRSAARDLPRRSRPVRGRPARPPPRQQGGPRGTRPPRARIVPGARHSGSRDDGRRLRQRSGRHRGHPLPVH